ncbi:LOW QUALITY PROTEIN: uncharacterized protein [Miscanthus floridulus]|uniref:LOW QUALITY PROTEIN: uncharacterized protein n=1 Tax=Miscanthus floridulus TaxID=154761 RepID=UPI003457F671
MMKTGYRLGGGVEHDGSAAEVVLAPGLVAVTDRVLTAPPPRAPRSRRGGFGLRSSRCPSLEARCWTAADVRAEIVACTRRSWRRKDRGLAGGVDGSVLCGGYDSYSAVAAEAATKQVEGAGLKEYDLALHLSADLFLFFSVDKQDRKFIYIETKAVGLKVVMMSPGFVYEPYSPRGHIPFWKRFFTPAGRRRVLRQLLLQMKNAYAVSRLRKKTGYTKKQFYDQALKIYKEVNTLMAHGDTSSLRKILTERMHSTIKNELKRRQSMWNSVHWELVEPAVSIRTLRARMIGLDKNDLDKVFIQLTLKFVTKQKFEAYNSRGAVVSGSGDKSKEVLVKDIWVFKRSLFHPGACWRVCGRITL